MRLLKYTAAKICRRGGMADASDSKSDGGNFVPVQVRPPAGTYDIVGDLKRKVAESYRSLRHISMFQITTYAVSTLTGMALIVMILLQLRIWNTFGFL